MSSVMIRFVGRFLFAEPVKNDKGTGELNVLAANLQYNNDISASQHTFLMTAPRSQVVFLGSRRPNLMVMSTLNITDPNVELSVWNLRDCEIVVGDQMNFTWDMEKDGGHALLADLFELTDGAAVFDPKHLNDSGVFTPVSSLVRLRTGTGRPRQVDPSEKQDFFKFDHTATTKKNRSLADVVEVLITLPQDVKRLTLKVKGRSGGPAGSITIAGGPDNAPTVVSFSNLCTTSHQAFDDEFAAFYDLLKNPPALCERLIPALPPTEGLEFDCFSASYLAYPV